MTPAVLMSERRIFQREPAMEFEAGEQGSQKHR
jgi:hypothetical protein